MKCPAGAPSGSSESRSAHGLNLTSSRTSGPPSGRRHTMARPSHSAHTDTIPGVGSQPSSSISTEILVTVARKDLLFLKRALGRLLSAARELVSHPSGSPRHEPSSGLSKRTTGDYGKKVSRELRRQSQERSEALAESAPRERPEARARLTRAWPAAPPQPGLRDIQHALAREHGHESWTAFAAAVASGPPSPAAPRRDAPRRRDQVPAVRLLGPSHARRGRSPDVRPRGAADPRAASGHRAAQPLHGHRVRRPRRGPARSRGTAGGGARAGRPRGWTPILYLSYTRFTHQRRSTTRSTIARLLLDHGANPNDFYMAGDSEYSCLVGAAGEGEQDSPRQPYAAKLYELLLERGAGPYDIQVLYDTHFSGDMLWWLELTYQRSLALGLKADWDDPDWSMLDMGGYGSGAAFVLGVAVKKDDSQARGWALTHGASPNSDTSSNPKYKPDRSLYEMAVVHQTDGDGGAPPSPRRQRRGPRASSGRGVHRRLHASRSRRRRGVPRTASGVSCAPTWRCSRRRSATGRTSSRCCSISAFRSRSPIAPTRARCTTQPPTTPFAPRSSSIDRGAEVDPRETSYDATPDRLGRARRPQEMLDFLSRHSRNVWTLTFRGFVDRLRDGPAGESGPCTGDRLGRLHAALVAARR